MSENLTRTHETVTLDGPMIRIARHGDLFVEGWYRNPRTVVDFGKVYFCANGRVGWMRLFVEPVPTVDENGQDVLLFAWRCDPPEGGCRGVKAELLPDSTEQGAATSRIVARQRAEQQARLWARVLCKVAA